MTSSLAIENECEFQNANNKECDFYKRMANTKIDEELSLESWDI